MKTNIIGPDHRVFGVDDLRARGRDPADFAPQAVDDSGTGRALRQSSFDTSANAGADIAERDAATRSGLTHSESKHEYHRT
ncbi:hypothetical protein [Xanthobacter versatilis]|uniref:hypothetical protein n=1 Tax=Xanthobacter autotrophicus (strain ATCC BAA-1158 / Py2) TaxID=78245 RepID=UPI00372CA377